MNDQLIPQRKRLAMGRGLLEGDFGVEKFGSSAVNGPAAAKSKYLGDHERGARPPIDGSQANPDHGDY